MERFGTKKQKQISKQTEDTPAKNEYLLDVIFFILVFLFAYPYLSFITSVLIQSTDPTLVDLGNKGTIGLRLLLAGLILALFFKVFKNDRVRVDFQFVGFTQEGFSKLITSLGVGIFVISIANFFLVGTTGEAARYALTGTDILLFTITMAIVEEVAFTFIFQVLFVFLFRSKYIGIISRPVAFTIFHLAVYGSQPNLLVSVFIAGLVFAIVFQLTKAISVNMIIHVVINALPIILPAISVAFGG